MARWQQVDKAVDSINNLVNIYFRMICLVTVLRINFFARRL